MPKISIIVPVYNIEKFINKSIDSVEKQTLSNFECRYKNLKKMEVQ